MKKLLALCGVFGLCWPALTHAGIYKCSDGVGRITYTNIKPAQADCRLIGGGNESRPSGVHHEASAATPEANVAIPKIDPQIQKSRDNDRQRILAQELAHERQALGLAQQQLSEQQAQLSRRNDASTQASFRSAQETVRSHQRNIELLQRELANAK
jgi:hypothetical protein